MTEYKDYYLDGIKKGRVELAKELLELFLDTGLEARITYTNLIRLRKRLESEVKGVNGKVYK